MLEEIIYIYIYSSATTTRSLEKAIISLRPIALQLTSGHTSSPELLKQILVHPENGSWSIRGLWLGVLGLLRKWSLGPSQVCVIHNLRQILRSYFLSKDSFRSNLTDSDSRCHFQNPQTCFKQFQLGVLKSSVHFPHPGNFHPRACRRSFMDTAPSATVLAKAVEASTAMAARPRYGTNFRASPRRYAGSVVAEDVAMERHKCNAVFLDMTTWFCRKCYWIQQVLKGTFNQVFWQVYLLCFLLSQNM